MQAGRMRGIVCGALAVALVAAAPAAGHERRQYAPGAPGLGDPYYPFAGNGGYDVKHYSLRLGYDPPDAATPRANHLDGRAVIVARATQNLSSFNLDLRPFMAVSGVRLNGRSAAFARNGEHELTVTPRKGIKAGRRFVADVEYSGTPEPVVDPDGSLEGWVPTDDGAFVVNEPQGSPGWYPVNDNPQDKATFDFTVTLPEGRTAIANGVLLGRFTRGGRTTWRWLEPHPMAPYLATATNGAFETRFGRTPAGLPVYNAVDAREAAAWTVLEKQPAIVARFSELYGRYPFSNVGAIVDHAPEVGYALESQGKANYSRAPSENTVAHEIAHQWFGNAVTPRQWPDIWLNEGFARWSEWIWFEGQPGQPTAQARFDTFYATPAENTAFWNPPPGNPGGPESLFDGTIYTRGAMTLQALRQKLGDGPFFRILRAWYAENRYGNVTTADFVALSERISGRQLDAFFDIWLYRPGKPEAGSW